MFESIKPRLVGNLCVDFIKIASMCCRSSMKSPGKRRRVDIVSDSPKRMRSAYPPKEDELHMDGVDALRTYFRRSNRNAMQESCSRAFLRCMLPRNAHFRGHVRHHVAAWDGDVQDIINPQRNGVRFNWVWGVC